jgi:hypothetical protein
MDDTPSSRQKKHTSALLKTQHRSANISKRTLAFSKDKGKMKTYRNLEHNQKNNLTTIEPRQYYCNRCKVWNNVVECNSCYVDWCGVNGDYHQCDFGQHDLCQYLVIFISISILLVILVIGNIKFISKNKNMKTGLVIFNGVD